MPDRKKARGGSSRRARTARPGRAEALADIFNIAGRRVVITGATGYFGRYMARTFLEVGAKVVLLGRSDRLAADVRQYRREFGKDRVAAFQVDFYDRVALEKTLRKVVRTFDVDVLVNNAYDLGPRTGFNIPTGRLETSTYEQWQSAFEAGIYWAVLATQIIGERFRTKGRGSIINVSSMYGAVSPHPSLYEGTPFFNPPSYGVNKAGIIAFSRYVASFWGSYGVRCNAILPGAFPNVESKSANSVTSGDGFIERLKRRTVLGRVGHPNDLKGVLIFLACDASGYVTGQAIGVDGGWTIT